MAFIDWDKADFKWNELDQFWNLVQEILSKSTGGVDPLKLEKLDKKKKKKLIRLIMHIKGEKIYDEEKEVKNISHRIEDITLIAEELKRNVQIIH
mgnify:FL=1|tara:strand:+ start:2250 stop:2534 length:285 start_codon:yes stop_codon:yes gene_type:complete